MMRDLAELKENGMPIESDRGRGGGIALVGRWGLNKLQAMLRLFPARFAITESMKSPILVDNIHSIKNRISSAFPIEQQRLISNIRKRIFIGEHAKETLADYKILAKGSLLI